MLERDDFSKRFQAEQPISLHELLYPVMQATTRSSSNATWNSAEPTRNSTSFADASSSATTARNRKLVMTPILEGTDGVQKMSKSLGNAIGINEPPAEMYGKLMSINDELMWKYFLFLTDLRGSEVDALKAEVAVGALHPMEAKKRLARTIVEGFHSESAAGSADENWARMFQQKETAEDLEEVSLAYADLVGPSGVPGALQIRLPKLLVSLGLAASGAEASRKIAEKAVSWTASRPGMLWFLLRDSLRNLSCAWASGPKSPRSRKMAHLTSQMAYTSTKR